MKDIDVQILKGQWTRSRINTNKIKPCLENSRAKLQTKEKEMGTKDFVSHSQLPLLPVSQQWNSEPGTALEIKPRVLVLSCTGKLDPNSQTFEGFPQSPSCSAVGCKYFRRCWTERSAIGGKIAFYPTGFPESQQHIGKGTQDRPWCPNCLDVHIEADSSSQMAEVSTPSGSPSWPAAPLLDYRNRGYFYGWDKSS